MEERTRQILDAAIELAEEGGFDTVKMRDVAAHAGVAMGTFYKRFRSKEDLLIAALNIEMEHLEDRLGKRATLTGTVHDRVVDFFMVATRRFCARPNLARAALRAVTAGDPDLSAKVAEYHARTTRLVVDAVTGDPGRTPTERELAMSDIFQQVWFAALVGWSGGILTVDAVAEKVRVAADLILHPPQAVA